MAHEITTSDNVVLVRERAWHNLGIVIPDAIRPTEALPLIGAEWGVQQWPLYASDGEKRIALEGQFLNVRDDTFEPLGIVTEHYQVFTNRQVADFCEALVEVDSQTKVRIETAGTIRGGKKVWFLLRGDEFEINSGDGMVPYVLVSNGHDGKTSLRVTPTTVRVVCSNTLHMVIPQDDSSNVCGSAAISIGHFGDLMGKVEEAKRALNQFDFALHSTRDRITHLAKQQVTRDKLIEFFVTNYERDFLVGDPDELSAKQMRRMDRMKDAQSSFMRRFDDEHSLAGSTWWNAFNAYSGLVQHDLKARGKDDEKRVESRINSNLFGLNAARTSAALQLALQIAG